MVDGPAPTPPAQRRARARRKSATRMWWRVHQWVGLKLSLLMSFILITGTIAVLSHEIDWLIHPDMRVDPATVSGEVNWPAMAETVAQARPDMHIDFLQAPVDPWFAATALGQRPDGDRRILLLHPETGALQGDISYMTVQRVFRFMHRHLFLPTAIGVPLVSAFSILLLISLATSFVVYKKWWRGFFKPLRGRDARTWSGDFHRLAGVWSIWFIALMILTGLWYLAESTVWRAPAHPRADVASAGLTSAEAGSRLADSLAAARAANPELRLKRILYPGERSGAFVFQGQDEALLVRPRSNAVWTDAVTGEVRLVTDGRDLNVHQRIAEMADPLHFGYFGGLATKAIWFFFGLLLSALSITGLAIYSFRLIKAERKPATAGGVIGRAWRGMGGWKWPSLALLATCFVLFGLALPRF